MWQQIQTAHNPKLLSASFLNQLKASLGDALTPAEINEPTAMAAASADTAKNAELLAVGKIEMLAITPWQHGQPSYRKDKLSFYLSAAEAHKIAIEKVENTGWQAVIIIAATADNEAGLHSELEKISQAFPFAEAQKAQRIAEHHANHEGQKRQLIKLTEKTAKATAAQMGFFVSQRPAAQQIEIAKAAGLDVGTAAMLSEFIQKRRARLDEIAAEISEIAETSGAITSVIYAAGNIRKTLESNPPENEQAQLCVMFALGGESLEKIKEAMQL